MKTLKSCDAYLITMKNLYIEDQIHEFMGQWFTRKSILFA